MRDTQVLNLVPESIRIPETRLYDFEILEASGGIPEAIRFSILGSKSLSLFVEGDVSSDDKLLYSRIYDGWTVLPQTGWESVVDTVRVLRKNSHYSWLSVYGIIDGDGHSASAKEKYEQDGIYCVAAPTIENLFGIGADPFPNGHRAPRIIRR